MNGYSIEKEKPLYGDKKLSVFICTYILASSLNMAIKTVFNIPESMWSIISIAFELAIILTLMLAFPILYKRKGAFLLVAEIFFGLLYMLSYFSGFAEPADLFSTAFWTLAVCIPLGSAGIAVYDKQLLFDYIRTASYIEYPFLCAALWSMRRVGTYSMSVSYALVLPVLFLLFSFFRDGKYISLFLAAVASLLILVYGARGPLLCIFFFIVVEMLQRHSSKRTISLLYCFIGLFSLLVILKDPLLQFLADFVSSHGINSYIINRIIAGKVLQTAGRDQIWVYYLQLIEKHPFSGYGLLGGWIDLSTGPHNMLLEFLLSFGIILGGFVSLLSIRLLIKSVSAKPSIYTDLVVIFASYNFTMFLVSGNWLEKPLFFLFVCLAVPMASSNAKFKTVLTYSRAH